MLPAGVDVLVRVRGAAPEQAVIMGARQAGQFAADQPEDFRGFQTGNEQPELARGGRGRGSGAEVGAGAGAAFDEALGL
jgi:hypothetical protein